MMTAHKANICLSTNFAFVMIALLAGKFFFLVFISVVAFAGHFSSLREQYDL